MASKLPGWDSFYAGLVEKFWDKLDEDSQQNLAGEPLPEDLRRAVCMIHPYPAGWFDNPIPNLDGRSPRQVLERRGGGDTLRAILIDIAPHFLPDSNGLALAARGEQKADPR